LAGDEVAGPIAGGQGNRVVGEDREQLFSTLLHAAFTEIVRR
jgi:hypothetical protein